MSLAFKRLKVYVRSVLIAVVAILIVTVLFKNRGHEVSFWFFGLTDETERVNVVWLMVWTAIVALISWWVLTLGWSLWRDMRELKRLDASRRLQQAQDKRDEELKRRERRIDEKIQHAISREDSDAAGKQGEG
jgi:type VI protein secretion system component VasK